MKISIVSASVSRKAGGVLDATVGLAQALMRSGNQLSVMSLSDESTQLDRDRWVGVDVHATHSLGPASFGYAPRLYDLILEGRSDVIHSHGLWMYSSIASVKAAKKNKVPYVISPHGMLDSWALNNSSVKKKIAYHLYEHSNLSGASCIHALCESEAQAIRDLHIKSPICIIPNGVELLGRDLKVAPKWLSDDLRDKRILLYLGRIHPKKGLSLLLDAWSQVSNRSDWHLVVAGWEQDGYLRVLRSQVEALGLTESVSFVGPQFDLGKVASFEAADAFVLPSHSEGLPMVILEAWMYGLPVLMTHACNIPEGQKAGAAITVETSLVGLRSGLDKLLGMNEVGRLAMGRSGRALVKESFTWEKVAESMLSVYQWIRGGSSKPNCVYLD